MISVQAYNEAVKEYTRGIFRFLYKSLRDEAAVHDIVQDCYLKLWQNRDKIDPQKIRPWLFSVAHHAMLNYLQASAKKVQLDENARMPPVYPTFHTC